MRDEFYGKNSVAISLQYRSFMSGEGIGKVSNFIFTQQRPEKPCTSYDLIVGRAEDGLRQLPDKSVRCFVTSPPYYHVFSYGVEGQCGLEPTVGDYVAYQAAIAKEMLRVATKDANLFLVIRDSFNRSGGTGGDYSDGNGGYRVEAVRGARERDWPRKAQLLVPERLRLAFVDAGWVPVLKIIWDKSDPRRAAQDRPSYSYEEILAFSQEENGLYEEIMLFSANPKHYFNRMAVLAPWAANTVPQINTDYQGKSGYDYTGGRREDPSDTKRRIIKSMESRAGAFLRAVWRIPPGNQPEVEVNGKAERGIACFPMLLAEICINLGSAPGDIVCDPFAGMGTTLMAALKWGRHAIGVELSPKFAAAARVRLERAGY